MLQFLREQLAALLTKRAAAATARDAILTAPTAEKRDLNEAERTTFDEQRTAVTTLDGEIADYQKRIKDLEDDEARNATAAQALADTGQAGTRRSGGAVVGNEPMTYGKHRGQSYFLDLARAQIRNDPDALQRLQRHAKELEVELPKREQRREQLAHEQLTSIEGLRPNQRASVFERGPGPQEQRVNPNRTDGQGGYFVPPLWLVDQYIDLPRFGRVTANLVTGFDLPGGTDSINLPKISTGTATGVQTADAAAVTSVDLTDTFVNAPVRTIAGQQDVAMQLLDQSPVNFDEVIFGDLIPDLNQKLDIQVLNGSGVSGQALGIFNVSGINTVTSTAGSTTFITLYAPMIKLLSQIAKNRKMRATAMITTPTRWYWASSVLDTQNRPLVLPVASGLMNAMAPVQTDAGAEGPVSMFQATPWYTDGNIPATFGGGTEDKILAVRAPDLFLWEGALRTRALAEVLSGTLQIRFQVWEYFAFMGNRRPESISVLSGSDLASSFTSGF